MGIGSFIRMPIAAFVGKNYVEGARMVSVLAYKGAPAGAPYSFAKILRHTTFALGQALGCKRRDARFVAHIVLRNMHGITVDGVECAKRRNHCTEAKEKIPRKPCYRRLALRAWGVE